MRYEAVNCRVFYTWEMAPGVEAIWKKVAAVAWRGGRCAKGSTTEEDDIIGGWPGYTQKVEARYKLGRGPGALRM